MTAPQTLTPSRTVLVAGASGLIGQATVEALAARGDADVIGVSRRPPVAMPTERFVHLPLDLSDARACADAVAAGPPVSHLVFAALHEKPGLVAGWRDAGQMDRNRAMLANLLGPLAETGALRHVSLLQGTKAYGVHRRPIPYPARERWERDPHPNFYWLQEDLLREAAARHGFGFTIWRPQIVFGTAHGVAMNPLLALGAFAALCRETGAPFAYPGGPAYPLEATDADLTAQAMLWAMDAPQADGEIFNITNGDVFAWPHLWPVIAGAFGVDAAPAAPLRLAEWLPSRADAWRRLAARHRLAEPDLAALLGESHHYADFCMASGHEAAPPPVLVSTIKLRQAGFAGCTDTEDMIRRHAAGLVARRVLPPLEPREDTTR